jgi:hypothetical protein
VTLRERWDAFSSRERGFVVLALLLGVLVVARNLPSGDEDEFAGSSDTRWVKVQRINNYRTIVSRGDAVAAQALSINARLQAQKARLIAGSTPAQIGAELQGFVSGLASEAGLNVLSSQVLKEDTAAGFPRVGVRLTLSGQLGGVSELLAGIEGGQHDVVISNVEISRKLGSSSRRPASTDTQSPLTVRLEVRSFLPEGLS